MSDDSKRITVHDEDDDIEDLDDVLEQFTPSKSVNTQSPLAAASPAPDTPPPHSSTSNSKDTTSAPDWAADFAQSMESFMREITEEFEGGKAGGVGFDDKGSGFGEPPKNETSEQKAARLTQEEAFAAAWETMLIEGMGELGMGGEGKAPPSASSKRPSASSASSKPVPPPTDDYQTRLRAAMNKLKESETTLKQAQDQSSASDPLEALLAQLGQVGDLEGLGGVGGGGGEEQLQGILEAMMGQLMGKDILYEPLKELDEKFPSYLTTHASTLSPTDKARYDAQIICIKRLLSIFDSPDYNDADKEKKEQVLLAMNELQAHGSPPEDLMGPLPPGFSMGADGLPNLGEGGDCVIC